MESILRIGQTLRGRASRYSVIKELYRAADQGAVYLATNDEGKKSVLKSVKGHWRLQNEVNILKKYQARTPFLRPLEDEIEDPEDPPTIVLKHLDSDLRTESKRKTLSRPEIKQVGKIILEVLHTLHQDGMVHTDIKLDNIFVNLGEPPEQRFANILIGDCGGVVHKDSKFARDGHLISSSIARSPEAGFQLPWKPPTDI